MTGRTYTEAETLALCVRAAEIALAKQPKASQVSTAEAAKMLDVHPQTIIRMKPPRIGGKIPYTWVLQRLQV